MFVCSLALLASFSTVEAQRIAYVDIDLILERIPDYQTAQAELDKTAARWKQEISQEYDRIKGQYNRYQAEQVLMSESARTAKEDEIMEMEKKAREMQKAKFGPDGALFRKRQELIKPIQDRVYSAIQEYAEARGFDFIFDKNSSAGLLFASPSYDKTDDILKRLGIE